MKILVEQATEEITLKMFIYLNIETGGYAIYCPVLGQQGGRNIPKNKSKVCLSNGWFMENQDRACTVGQFCSSYLNTVNIPLSSPRHSTAALSNSLPEFLTY